MVRRREDEGGEQLTDPQRLELVGRFSAMETDEFDSVFVSDEHRRKAWNEHRAELLATYIDEHPGKRPPAWWKYEAPRDRPAFPEDRPPGAPTDLPNEAAWLWSIGVLTPEERFRCEPPSPAEGAAMAGSEPWHRRTSQNGDQP